MIISHQHKFIFFAIPKTGTHSIRFALRPHLGINDEEHVNLFYQSKLNLTSFNERTDGHISVSEIKPHINAEIWNSYFKFCFVRNPWDRFVSAVFFKNQTVQRQPKLAAPLMAYTLAKLKSEPNLWFRAQTSFLLNTENEIEMDFIGRVENMQDDFDKICSKLNLPQIDLEHRNTSKHDDYKIYYTEELKNKVSELYQEDIERLAYQF